MKVKSLWGLPVLKLLAGSSLAGSSRNAAAMYLVRQMFFFASPDDFVFLCRKCHMSDLDNVLEALERARRQERD